MYSSRRVIAIAGSVVFVRNVCILRIGVVQGHCCTELVVGTRSGDTKRERKTHRSNTVDKERKAIKLRLPTNPPF